MLYKIKNFMYKIYLKIKAWSIFCFNIVKKPFSNMYKKQNEKIVLYLTKGNLKSKKQKNRNAEKILMRKIKKYIKKKKKEIKNKFKKK